MRLFHDSEKLDRRQRRFFTRAALLTLAGTAILGLLVARISYLTLNRGPALHELSTRNYIRKEPVEAPRGSIRDRQGLVLAHSEPCFNVHLGAYGLPEDERVHTFETALALLPPAKRPSETKRDEILASSRRELLAEQLSLQQVIPLRERQAALPGLQIEQTFKRVYPYGRAASHLTGYVGAIPPAQLQPRLEEGYSRRDTIGRAALEKQFEPVLRGTKGMELVYRDATERRISGQVLEGHEARRGGNIDLSLDIRLQQVAIEALRKTEHIGALVALDPRNGEVLAMVSLPDYDANEPQRASAEGNSSFNKAIRTYYGYAPGSTFKIITAAAALIAGKTTPQRTVFCDGRFRVGRDNYRKCLYRHGDVNLKRALEVSCNIYFYQMASDLSFAELVGTSAAFGFGQPAGLEIPSSKGVLGMNDPAAEPLWVDRVMMGIGQGRLIGVTPIQMAVAYAVLANGGTRYAAHLVRQIESSNGQVRNSEPIPRDTLDWTPAQRDAILEGVRAVVESRSGTGRHAKFDPEWKVAGKTGTAETGRGTAHAWFCCFAPWDNPEICIVVLVEDAGHGGEVAAPIARDVLEAYYELKPTG